MVKIYALPFKISKEEANTILIKNKNFFEKDIIKKPGIQLYKGEYVKKLYVPFHSIDIQNLQTRYIGKYGIIKYRTEWYFDFQAKKFRTRTVSYTDWHKCEGKIIGNYEFGHKITQIYAGLKYSNKMIEKCLYFDVRDRDNFVDITQIKHDAEIDPHEMKIGFGLEKIIHNVNENERQQVRLDILINHNADESQIDNMSIDIENADVKLYSYYMPTYVHCIKNGNYECHTFVSGYNGRTIGTKILSFPKFYILGSVIGTALSFHPAFAPFLGPSLFIRLFIRLLIGNFSGGIGIVAKSYSKIKAFLYKREIDFHIKENSKYMSTDDDVNRIKFATSNNIVDDKMKSMLTLLGIDYNEQVITSEMIKNRYHILIKKYHPDSYNGDKEFAKNMSQQLNKVYKELLNHYKK